MKAKFNILLCLLLSGLLFVGCRTREVGSTVRINVPMITESNIVSVADCSSGLFLQKAPWYTTSSRKNNGPYFVALSDSKFYCCYVEKLGKGILISIDEEWKYGAPVSTGTYSISNDSIVTIKCDTESRDEIYFDYVPELGDTLLISCDISSLSGRRFVDDYLCKVKFQGVNHESLVEGISSVGSSDGKTVVVKIPSKDGKQVEFVRFEPSRKKATVSFNLYLTDFGSNYANIIDRRLPELRNKPVNRIELSLKNSVFPNPLKAKLENRMLKILTLDGAVSDISIPLLVKVESGESEDKKVEVSRLK